MAAKSLSGFLNPAPWLDRDDTGWTGVDGLFGAANGYSDPIATGFGAASLIGTVTPIDAPLAFGGFDSAFGSIRSGGSSAKLLSEYKSGSLDGNQGYDIWIAFQGRGWTADLQQAFITAANYFTSVITEDVGGGIYRGKLIDDVYITAEVKAIDGPGGILGQAGPTAVWTANELTAAGQMQFDVADAKNYLGQGLWDDIVTHEMMHVLGFGSLWNYGNNPLVTTPGEYTGAAGLAAYQASHSGAQFIPVETDGGSGTAGAHWDEASLGNELMTGYINASNYLSDFSVKSLQDLGYTVGNYHPLSLA